MIDLLRSASASPLAQTVPTDPGNAWVKDELVAIDAPPDGDADPSPEARWPTNARRTGMYGVVGPRIITLPDGRYRLYYTQITPRVGFPAAPWRDDSSVAPDFHRLFCSNVLFEPFRRYAAAFSTSRITRRVFAPRIFSISESEKPL